MRIDQLIFVGLNGYAVALDRDTGEIVWSNDQMKSGYVTLLLDGDRLSLSLRCQLSHFFRWCLDWFRRRYCRWRFRRGWLTHNGRFCDRDRGGPSVQEEDYATNPRQHQCGHTNNQRHSSIRGTA